MDSLRPPEVVHLPVSSLLELPGNPNEMADAEYAALVAAIRANGFLQPILVCPPQGEGVGHGAGQVVGQEGYYPPDAHYVIDGQHRLRAARELSLPAVPCVVVRVTREQAQALRVAMNRLRGELDLTAVGRIFQELSDAGWTGGQLAQTGFSVGEVEDLLRAVSQPVDASPLPVDMGTPDYDAGAPSEPPRKRHVLEVEFETAQQLTRARKALAAGGSTLGEGLLRLLVLAKQGGKPARGRARRKA